MKILITGASRGIGQATALALAADSSHQILALSRNEEGLEQLYKVSQEKYGYDNLHYLPFDLTQPDVERLLEKVIQMGGVEVLVNNAAWLVNKPFGDLSRADWLHTFEVNLFGAVNLIQLLLPYLEAEETAHIVNISSMGGYHGSLKFPGLSAYSASKAALANLTECLAEEWKDKNIAVNCLALGAVQTEMLLQAFPGYEAPLDSKKMASFLAYFSTQGHHFFNGKVLPVSLSTP